MSIYVYISSFSEKGPPGRRFLFSLVLATLRYIPKMIPGVIVVNSRNQLRYCHSYRREGHLVGIANIQSWVCQKDTAD